MIAYLFLFCDRTRDLAKMYYPLMRREQVAAVQVLVAILLPKPELIDPCIEKLCATAKGAQYLDAIKGVLLESMHTPQRSHRSNGTRTCVRSSENLASSMTTIPRTMSPAISTSPPRNLPAFT